MNPLLKASVLKSGGVSAPQEQSTSSNQTMTEQEQKLLQMYGKLPTRKALLGQKLKERKYFDSGDYALSKAGKTTVPVGSQHPQPENIPHSNAASSNSSPGAHPHHQPQHLHYGSPPARESLLVYERS